MRGRLLLSFLALVLVGSCGGNAKHFTSASTKRPAAAPSTLDDAVSQASRSPNATRIMVVGNSVGWYIADALKQQHTRHTAVFLNFAGPTCFFPHDIDALRVKKPDGSTQTLQKLPCDGFWSLALARFHPQTVVFILAAADPYDVRVNGIWLHPCSPPWTAMEQRRLREAVATLASEGARVAIATAAYSRVPGQNGDAVADCDNHLRRDAAAATGAQLVDIFSRVRPSGVCHNTENAVTLRPDGLHFRGDGARVIAQWLVAELHI